MLCHFQFRYALSLSISCRYIVTNTVQMSLYSFCSAVSVNSKLDYMKDPTDLDKFLILVKGTPHLSANQLTAKSKCPNKCIAGISGSRLAKKRGKLSGMNIAGKSSKYVQFLQKQLLSDQSIYLKLSFESKTETYQGMQTKVNRNQKWHRDIARCVSL